MCEEWVISPPPQSPSVLCDFSVSVFLINSISDILKKYNPQIKGYSTGIGTWDGRFSKLNFAVPGAVA